MFFAKKSKLLNLAIAIVKRVYKIGNIKQSQDSVLWQHCYYCFKLNSICVMQVYFQQLSLDGNEHSKGFVLAIENCCQNGCI
jgi:hypothetical protein